MAVVETQSTNTRIVVFHSTNGTLATAIEEVLDELDDQKIGQSKILGTDLVHDGTNFVYAVTVKKAP